MIFLVRLGEFPITKNIIITLIVTRELNSHQIKRVTTCKILSQITCDSLFYRRGNSISKNHLENNRFYAD